MEIFDNELATAVVSCDSPRFLSFIPAAPTKASLLFDMVVACSSLQGTSWMEAAGAVAAENQALGVLADLAGLPAGAGGCFVSGGSAGNLSALMVARDTAAHRMGDRAPDRPVIAISEEAHSSVGKALRVLGVEALVVPCDDHRLTGRGLPAALDGHPRGDDAIGVVATGGTTNAGIIDDLAGVGEVARERSLWFHVDGAYGCAALFAPSVRGPVRRHRAGGLVRRRPPQVAVRPVRLRRPHLPGAPTWPRPCTPRTPPTSTCSTPTPGRVESQRLRLPPDPAGPGAAPVVLPGRQRHRRLPRRHRDGAGRHPGSADLIERTPYLELVRRPELSVVLFRRTGWDRDDYERWSARAARTTRSASWCPRPGRASRSGRLALLHPDTTIDIIEEILATMA